MSIKGKHITITGAAQGIGRATSVAALGAGARVTDLDIVVPDIEGLAHLHCDVSNPEDWASAAGQVTEVDHLLLNAGVMSAPNGANEAAYTFDSVNLEGYRRIMGVNVDGVVFGLKALLPKMRKGSSVVVTASLAGVYPYAHDPLYSMTKHAVVGLVRSLAPVLRARAIRINAICPNRVDTDLLPVDQRVREYLSPESVAKEIITLFGASHSGGVYGKMSNTEPLYPIRTVAGHQDWKSRGRRWLNRIRTAATDRAPSEFR